MGKFSKKISNFLKKLKKEICGHKLEYALLLMILAFSAFFRFFRLGQLLGFWYDQGRDALVIWDLLHYGKFFLIGPVTGIEGIFLGPFYYYLLAPLYWLGKGSPVFAAGGLSLLTVGAIFLIYLLGKKIFNAKIGLLAAFLYGFSYSQVIFSRWLANPNPLPFFTMVLLLLLYGFIKGKKNYLIFAALVAGLCLQLEAAAAIFFLPTILIVVFLNRKQLTLKVAFLSFLAFFITLLPQIYFNFRHQGILFEAFKKFLVTENSFGSQGHLGQNLFIVLKQRIMLYYDVFFGKFFPQGGWWKISPLALFSASFFFFKKRDSSDGNKFLWLWVVIPLIGYVFYRGNNGYIWDYYFTGLIPAFFILFAASLIKLIEKHWFFKIVILIFLLVFTWSNLRFLRNYFTAGIGIALRSQTRAIDWVYKEAENEEFNIDVYVPPQIFFSYSYLFRWYGTTKYGREPATKLVKNLFTLSEPDGERPFLLERWLKRQDGIGKIEKSYSWGDISVERRERIIYEQ